MSLTKDSSKFKIFCADTGLFVTLAFWDKDHTENVIYQKLLNDKLSTNLGYVYENIIAQMLASSGNKLFYYTWPKDENHNYEIDFLLSRGAKLHPIEVKSSGYRTHKSLDVFCEKFSHIIDRRYLIYTKDLKKDEETILLPVYMTPFLWSQTNNKLIKTIMVVIKLSPLWLLLCKKKYFDEHFDGICIQ